MRYDRDGHCDEDALHGVPIETIKCADYLKRMLRQHQPNRQQQQT